MPENQFPAYKNINGPNVPIVTYHSIADTIDGWQFRHLSCPVATFESHLRALRRASFQSISLHELYSYMTEGKGIPSRSVILTFDDGYLDNWVFAYPLLRKYGFIGTIFVNPDFVDPSESLRPNLDDTWNGSISFDELPTSGFLSWEEMRAMEKSGTIDIQSHALTHTWYFSSPDMIDFHHPGDHYPWLAWNVNPARKYMWMTENQQTFVPWGTPVYRYEKSLITRRYYPDPDLEKALVEYVRSNGGENFFQNDDWRQQLANVVAAYYQTHGKRDYQESEVEHRVRLYHELAGSKNMIEYQLGKKVDFLCWPGGGYDDISVDVFKEVGYLASVHSSWDRRISKNRFGEDPSHLSRISPPVFRKSETMVEYKGGFYLISLLNSLRGSFFHTCLYKALKIPYKLSQLFLHS